MILRAGLVCRSVLLLRLTDVSLRGGWRTFQLVDVLSRNLSALIMSLAQSVS